MEATTIIPNLINLDNDGKRLFEVQSQMKTLYERWEKIIWFMPIVIVTSMMAMLFAGLSIRYSLKLELFGSVSSLIGLLAVVRAVWFNTKNKYKADNLMKLGDEIHFLIANDIEKNYFIDRNYKIPLFIEDILGLYIERKKDLTRHTSNYTGEAMIYIFFFMTLLSLSISITPAMYREGKTKDHQIDSLKRVNETLQKKIQELENKR